MKFMRFEHGGTCASVVAGNFWSASPMNRSTASLIAKDGSDWLGRSLLSDRPDKARQFARDRRAYLHLQLAFAIQQPVTRAQALLRVPGNVLHRIRRALGAPLQERRFTRRIPFTLELMKQWIERNLTVLDAAFGVLFSPLCGDDFLFGFTITVASM